MNYIESVFMCLTAPLLFAVIGMHGRSKRLMIFLISGMAMSLLSAYISSFLAAAQGADVLHASIEISPLVEEIMKFLPVLFFILVMEASEVAIADSVMMTAVGFATFENCCFILSSGAPQLAYVMVRGAAVGVMHIVTLVALAKGMQLLKAYKAFSLAGIAGVLSLSVTGHGLYNLLVSKPGVSSYIGYVMPMLCAIVLYMINSKTERYGEK